MSRIIKPKASVHFDAAETEALHSELGKLIFSDYKGNRCAFLMRSNRLVSVYFMESDNLNSIYICKVKKIVKSINACFVEIYNGEICFLPLKDAVIPFILNRKMDGRLLEGDEFPVQIVRAAQKTKQATVTACISLSNDYFVMTWGTKGIQYSKRLTKAQINTLEEGLLQHIHELTNIAPVNEEHSFIDKEWSDVLRKTSQVESVYARELSIGDKPIHLGIKMRTKAAEHIESQKDIDFLIAQLDKLYITFTGLLRNACYRKCFSCLLKPKNEMEELLENQLSYEDFNEIITDNTDIYEQICSIMKKNSANKSVRLYKDTSFPLHKLYSLNTRMEEALSPRVWLKCGGYLIIQPTEALTVIDVNSGKYEGRRVNDEEAAFKVNLEAAEEIALQLRLRNLSGIIVVDFINMNEEAHKIALLKSMKSYVQSDKIKTIIVDMTPLGLVEITRKKVNKPLLEYIKGNTISNS